MDNFKLKMMLIPAAKRRTKIIRALAQIRDEGRVPEVAGRIDETGHAAGAYDEGACGSHSDADGVGRGFGAEIGRGRVSTPSALMGMVPVSVDTGGFRWQFRDNCETRAGRNSGLAPKLRMPYCRPAMRELLPSQPH